MTQTPENKTPESKEGEKLYAGKFKTVEDLEAGYKNSLPVHQENETLKKKVEDLTKVPESYAKPQGIELPDDQWATLQGMAKNSALTQSQFDKLASQTHERITQGALGYENAKKELGADKINLLQDYLKKTYPEKVAEQLLSNAIVDKTIREELLGARERSLGSTVPGMGKPGAPFNYSVTHDDVMKAHAKMEKASGREKTRARDEYIALSGQYAREKQAQKAAH